ncbi:nickel/cobalt transporter [Paracoccus sp. NSM]|uniref:nickel/cobalt transporter n=1 Tax=Paracoccus sp. NSM TaxID=3457784 RepID=UPI004036E3D2
MSAPGLRSPASGLGRVLALTGLVAGLALMALWLSGGLSGIAAWAAAGQRQAQNLMAGALQSLRAGDPGAAATLLALCFGYGFFHAAGPGHGKLVIGSYGYGSQVPFGRLAVLSLLSSLAQAGTAILLVWLGLAALDLGREELTRLSERHMADLATVLIGLVGLWLALRGLRMLRDVARPAPAHDHQHHDETCGCGHAHGPSPAQVAQTRSFRDGLLVVLAIAARPCTGALFLLLLTWRMEIFAMGVAGTVAMGLGTASVTVAVAGLSVWARRGSLALVPQTGPLAAVSRWMPGAMQLGAGALIALAAALMLV